MYRIKIILFLSVSIFASSAVSAADDNMPLRHCFGVLWEETGAGSCGQAVEVFMPAERVAEERETKRDQVIPNFPSTLWTLVEQYRCEPDTNLEDMLISLNFAAFKDLREKLEKIRDNISFENYRRFDGLAHVGVDDLRTTHFLVTNLKAAHVGKLANFPHLKKLFINQNHSALLKPENDLASLWNMLPTMKLATLSITDYFLSPNEINTLAAALPGSQIQNLELSHNSINDAGAKALAMVLRNSQIQVLCLTRNYIGAEGAQALVEGWQDSQVRQLHLSKFNINIVRLQALVMSLQKSQARQLYIERINICKIDTVIAEAMSRRKGLEMYL